ncbi:cysteine desulfurase [Corynebacterium sp. 13CS0277]|uniref:aminotransferase class V-fold PLP-dependent enzyme n=1 Tax=Corynebacterium sp. 13CS0277 TaxID=2071994 RepID=UPI000D0257C4|nr:aminotransferase class V-fold PLP-dependent enzyme [Corynebacterium sp. 13CS0277]PRQ10430.1 cysteine desulfurase [Corynebacterium sp. 13CS0277]
MGIDLARVRGLYASLSDGWTYFNGHELAQIPERVSSGVATAFRTSPLVAAVEPARGSHSKAQPAGVPTGLAHDAAARRAIADLVGAAADRVVLGPNPQTLLRGFVEAFRPRLARAGQPVPPGAVVVARSLSAPIADVFAGLPARIAEPDLGTGELPVWQFHDIVDGGTRLVVVPAAHRLVGTQTDVAAVRDIVREHSRAWLVVDASDVAPYQPIDMDAWGADAVLLDVAALGGPQLAALVVRDVSMFPRLQALTPGAEGAAALEVGPLSMGLLGGVAPTIDHLADLDEDARGTRRNRLRRSLGALNAHTGQLATHLVESLGSLGAVHLVGITGEAAAGAPAARTPRVTFLVHGVDAHTVHERLLANGIVAQVSPRDPLLEAMGAADAGGTVTVSLSPFNTSADVDQLVRVVASLA